MINSQNWSKNDCGLLFDDMWQTKNSHKWTFFLRGCISSLRCLVLAWSTGFAVRLTPLRLSYHNTWIVGEQILISLSKALSHKILVVA